MGEPELVDSARLTLHTWITSRRPNLSTAHRLGGYIPSFRMLQRFTVRRMKRDEKLFLHLSTLRDYG